MAGELEEKDLNPVTEVRKKIDGSLVIERVHEKPVVNTETHNMDDLRDTIAKYQAVIDVWQARIDPLKALIDEYEGMA